MLPLKTSLRQRLNRLVQAFLRNPPEGIRCLVYHSLTVEENPDPVQMHTPVRLFEQQMTYLAENGYRVLSCLELVSRVRSGKSVPPKMVSLSFDDGEASLYSLAFPILQRHRIPATVFSMAEIQGGAYLTWQQARRMQESGLIEFGCHGATHRRLRGLSDGELARETAAAKERMEAKLGRSVPLFAYPFGSYGTWDPPAIGALQEAGFQGAFTSVFGVNGPRTSPYLLRRSRVSWFDSLPQFCCLLEGAGDWYAWIQRAQGLFS